MSGPWEAAAEPVQGGQGEAGRGRAVPPPPRTAGRRDAALGDGGETVVLDLGRVDPRGARGRLP